jgi:hypothetical protein
VTDDYDWWPVAERLANLIGQPLLAEGVAPHRVRTPTRARKATDGAEPQLELDLDRPT